MSLYKQNGKVRWLPSYLRHQGKITKSQKRAIQRLWPRYGIDFSYNQTISLWNHFPEEKPISLEIGFGKGENIVHLAKANPQKQYLGIEVHRPGIGTTLQKIEQYQLQNIRIVRGDALCFLSDHLKEPFFDEVFIFFPNPWQGHKDKKRLLVQTFSIEIIANKVYPNTNLYLATDVEEYAKHMKSTIESDNQWSNQSTGFAKRPSWRPITKYERKALDRRDVIYDLWFCYQPSLRS